MKKKTGSIKLHIFYWCVIIVVLVILSLVIYTEKKIGKDTIDQTIDVLVNNGITIILSIICSIIASIMFTVFMSEKEESDRLSFKQEIRENIRQITEQLYDEKIADGVQRVVQQVSDVYNTTTDMMPSYYYPSADHPNLQFNKYLNKKITESKKFIYYGESARFTCKRLYKLKEEIDSIKNLEIEIYLVNPKCNDIFKSNRAFLETKESNKNYGKSRNWDEIVKEEKLKVLYCLYALQQMAQDFFKIDIYLINDVPFIDIEMTDDMIALEFFRTRENYKRYPLTIIYDKKKIYYESYEFYLKWEKTKAGSRIEAKNLTIDKILGLGKEWGLKDLTEENLKDYCNKEIFNELESYI